MSKKGGTVYEVFNRNGDENRYERGLTNGILFS